MLAKAVVLAALTRSSAKTSFFMAVIPLVVGIMWQASSACQQLVHSVSEPAEIKCGIDILNPPFLDIGITFHG